MGTWNPGPGGTNGNDTFVGNATNETIEGLGGEDNLQGNDGDDTFVISAASHISAGDFYYGGNGSDTMRLTAGGTYNFAPTTSLLSIETLRIEANLTANFSATYWDDDWDIINGWMVDGGGRNVTFNFFAIEGANISLAGWTLSNGNFTVNMYADTEGSSLSGTNVADRINGGAGNDVLRGYDGADVLTGGAGDDTYYLSSFSNDALNDTIVELAGGGIDTIETETSVSLAAYANIENLESRTNTGITLTGNGFDNSIIGGALANDTLIGGAGNDRLNGRSGVDTLIGGTGDDTYIFSQDSGDTVIENVNEGIDLIIVSNLNSATVTSFSMANFANVENLQYNSTNATGTRTITGNAGNNIITASGPGTSDTIDGGAGDDTLSGGGGNDTYIVDSLGDVVVESAAGGTDTIRTTTTTYVLSNAADRVIENLTYTGAAAFGGRGNDLNNILTGGAGDDTLEGGVGDDTLAGAGGADTASYSNAANAVNVSLSIAGAQATGVGSDTLTSIENLTGSAFGDQLRGNAGANALIGGDGGDYLDAGAGADRMDGGAGDDVVIWDSADLLDYVQGGDGADLLVFTSGGPPVDFNLANHGFELAEGRFTMSGAAFTDFYDGQWRLSHERGAASNGSSWFIDWDETLSAPYQRLNQDFDTAGQLAHEYGLADNGSTWDQFFDTDGTHSYTSILQVHTAGGVYANEHGINDNGSTWDTFYDVDGTNPFQWIQQVRDANGVLAQEEGLADGGTRWFTDYDETGTTDYVFYQNVYDTLNRLSFQSGTYDTGYTWTIDYDETNTQPWTSIRNDYDDHGVLIGTTTILDGP